MANGARTTGQRGGKQTKFIFVTGGVVSSLGKGLASASIGALLENRGLKVTIQKLDPYINVDPGTMNPIQHGEVFVTDDGAETDLDLGHYERFISARMTRLNNFTTGQIYWTSSRRSAAATTSAARCRSFRTSPTRSRSASCKCAEGNDVLIVEVGGTVGDIESLPFLEALRQLRIEQGPQNVVSRAPDAGAVHRRRRRAQDQAHAALGAEAARDRHPARHPHLPLRSPARGQPEEEDRALLQRRRRRRLHVAGRAERSTRCRCSLHDEGLDEKICELLNIWSRAPGLEGWQRIVEKVKPAVARR